MKSMDDLFHNALQDMYYAEKQLLRTLPKLAKHSSSAELEKAFNDHREQTEGHVKRLEQIFDMIGRSHAARNATPSSALSPRATRS